jgi:hypothetical protein
VGSAHTKEHSQQSSPGGLRGGGGGGKYEQGENTGKRERKFPKLSLVVDTEAANKEQESKMQYKMQRLLGELAVRLC